MKKITAILAGILIVIIVSCAKKLSPTEPGPVNTPNQTATAEAILTAAVMSYTPTFTVTLTETPTRTDTAEDTPENTATCTATATLPDTATETASPSFTLTDTPVDTETITGTATLVDTATQTVTETGTSTHTPTQTMTGTYTRTFTPTFTATATNTPVLYRLTLNRIGGGISATSLDGHMNCGTDCVYDYAPGATVTLNATTDPCRSFSGWTGGGCSSGSCIVIMNQDYTVSFTSSMLTYGATVTRSGAGSGSVSSAPAGISCGSTCSAIYDCGTMVTLTASPSTYSDFAGWSGACTNSSGPCYVLATAAKNVNAAFNKTIYNLVINKGGAGAGLVSSSPAGINCNAACSMASYGYDAGTVVALTATQDANSVFTGWSGGGCSGTGTCNVTMDSEKTVTANFVKATYNVAVTVTGAGSVSADSGPISGCTSTGGTCSGLYDAGTTVTLTESGGTFLGWSGSCVGTSTTCMFTVNAAKLVTASFNP